MLELKVGEAPSLDDLRRRLAGRVSIARRRFSRHQACALCNRPYKRYPSFASLEPSGQRFRTKAEERSWPSYNVLI